jgi:hypothetical protein
LFLLIIAVPATAHTFGFSIGASVPACLAIGDTNYRIAAPGERPDYTVRIDPDAAAPDVRIQLTGSIDEADFVVIADGDAAPRCPRGVSGSKSVKLDTAAPAPDLVLGLASASTPADFRIYVRGQSLAPEAAAALYAAAHMRSRRVAERAANDSH